MSAHTKGPWEAVQPTAIDYRPMQIQTADSLIAVCCGGGPKRAISAPEERANAALIAAAPDLLEALKEYVRDFGDNEDSDSKRMADKALAAISKAEHARKEAGL